MIWAILAGGAALLGGIAGAIGAAQTSKAQQEMAEANQTQAEKEAEQIQEASRLQVSDLKTQQKQFMGQQKALIGRSGVKLTTGSPVALMAETSRRATEDVRRLELAGQMETEARLFEASQYGEQAEMYRRTRPWQVAGSLFSGVASGASYFV